MGHLLRLSQKAAITMVQLYCLKKTVEDYACEIILVQGSSMYPTFDSGKSLLLINKSKYVIRSVSAGDVVVAISPNDPTNLIIKRVAQTGSDLEKSGIASQSLLAKIPANHVWLLGDNPATSVDSRNYGAVPCALITGKLAAILSS